MKLTVLIPMYNEAAILPQTVEALTTYMKCRFHGDYEILFVDDGSTDGSAAMVEKIGDGATRVLRYEKNRGKGCAVRTGMLAARGETVIFTDCDLAYGCEVIGEMADLFAAQEETDAIVGSRALHPDGYAGYSLLRRLFSRGYRRLLRLFFGLRLSDSQSGIKGFRREAAKAVFSRCEVDRYAFDFEAIMVGQRLGLRFAEMPVRILYNRPGHVRLLRDSLRMLRDLTRIRRRVRRMQPLPRGAAEGARPPRGE